METLELVTVVQSTEVFDQVSDVLEMQTDKLYGASIWHLYGSRLFQTINHISS